MGWAWEAFTGFAAAAAQATTTVLINPDRYSRNMVVRPPRIVWFATLVLGLAVAPAATAQGQASPPRTTETEHAATGTPLPDITTLLQRVRSRYTELQSLRKNYIFTITQTADEFASDGSKKSHTDEYQAFFVNDTEVRQHISHDGKPLSTADARKEQARVDKEVAELKAGHKRRQEVKLSASGLLKVATFSNPRREVLNGRPTLVFDYKGDPHAHADGVAEEVTRLLAGTLWVDERDEAILRLNGRLDANFHVGGGLLVNIRKGSWFDFAQAPVNGEIWFPREFTAHVDGRVLLIKGFDGDARQTFSDYRKLRTTVTILPGSHVVEQTGTEQPGEAAGADKASPAASPGSKP